MFSLSLAFYIATMIMGLLFVPFTVYYYEGLDDSDDSDDKTYVFPLSCPAGVQSECLYKSRQTNGSIPYRHICNTGLTRVS